ncbi:AI-2E family transporter [Croceibacter atlanticus]|jgi:predicted PurR-regulated permease PerM|uniref:AI-2E family transporter n=1 Tax=Croceibacter atlanticus TaxID=313588 RepID=UPI000E9BCA15|nr:AI-2E family transporter [Croceibacter atlanticus]WSP34565.1 AI-2E family transporter [Croceibacter atlanticus]HAT69819.1 AI-2E family transporter [Flavobacteriaceae bacterium]|tara:strand:+ start:381 stop:1400 length:1020 start_codon:yes stop_codon:yes gene_type:complete
MKKLSPTLVRQLFVIIVILFLLILIFREIIPYLGGVLGAITFYVLLRKWMVILLRKGWNENLASGLLMLGSFVGILVPISLIIIMLTSKIGKAVDNSERVIEAVKTQVDKWELSVGYDLSSQIDTGKIASWVGDNLKNLAGGTFDAFIAIGILYFMLYYMLTNRSQLREALDEYIPIGHDNLILIGKESSDLVRANAIGIPLVAICQGIIALIGFLIFGVPDPFFWFVITTIGSMIPFIGTAIGIIPVTILLYAQGMHWQAIAIFIYGMVVVGATDNFIRLYMLQKLSNVHPLITLFGVVVGVPLFGFIGLIFGPLLISLFLLIVKIYKNEYGKNEARL